MSLGTFPLDEIDALIFDFGGVILPLTFENTILALSELLQTDASRHFTRLSQTSVFDDFETGRIDTQEFEERLWQSAAARPSDGQARERYAQSFERAWNALLGDIPEKNLDVLQRLGKTKRMFLLSNTNEVHLRGALSDYQRAHGSRGPFEALFEKVHYSHLMGLRKPDPRIFVRLIEEHQLVPQRTLFIDDNEHNISSAASVGLVACHHPKNSPLPERFHLPE